MLKIVLLVLGAVIVIFVVIVAMQPSTYAVRRSATITTPPANVFALVNDFHRWQAWSPWEKLDPNMKRTYEGSQAGIGSVYAWSGNSQAGEGRMTIIDSQPNERVGIKLEFTRPFPSTSTTLFTLKPDGNSVVVDWMMTGQNTFMTKAFSLFKSMDSMVGPDFEKGLAQLKTAAETHS